MSRHGITSGDGNVRIVALLSGRINLIFEVVLSLENNMTIGLLPLGTGH